MAYYNKLLDLSAIVPRNGNHRHQERNHRSTNANRSTSRTEV